MTEYVKHHYIPQFILKNFIISNKVYSFNHIEFKLKQSSTRNIFMIENLYDYDKEEDIKIIEKELASRIESPMGQIVSRILNDLSICNHGNRSITEVVFTRKELNIIKKYMMLQFYRTEGNMTYYLDQNIKDKNQLSKYNINEGESKKDFWKREMKYILDNDWKQLTNSDMLGVKKFALTLQGGYLGVFVANSEFIISDLGKVAERMPFKTDKKTLDELIVAIKKYPELQIYPDTVELLKIEFKKQSSFVDNFYYFPISPKVAIVTFDRSWLLKLSGYPKLDYM